MLKPLSEQSCHHYPVADAETAHREAQAHLHEIPAWQTDTENRQIERQFKFADFNTTMQFVNAVADIATEQDHHPELHVCYGVCRVIYTTHSISTLSMNDIICAARIDRLYTSLAN